jgi:hypothetical protein
MKAQIFGLNSQQELCRTIEYLLRDNVFRHIDLQRLTISDNYSRASSTEEHKACMAYIRLLKACMIKVEDFRIVVSDDRGNWCYMGGYYGEVGSKAARDLKIFHDSMTSVFPAVAIMGRLVMVPTNIHEAFEESRDFPWFLTPLDLRGVALVDFQYPDLISEGVRQVSGQLKTEVVKLCRRYMLARRILKPDFKHLAKLLEIDELYLGQHQNEMRDPVTRLTPKIVSGPAQLGRKSLVVLEIRDESEREVERVHVQIRGPYNTLKHPVAETLDFSVAGGRVRRLQFEVFPKASPYCPLEVLFDVDETAQMYGAFPIPMILDVSS